MRKLTRSILATTAVAGLLALPVAGASADNPQVIDASVANTITIDATPASRDIGTLPITLAEPASLGQVQVSSNEAYSLNLTANFDRMTGWDTTLETPAYDTDRALTSPFLVTAVNNDTVTGGVGNAAVAATTTTALLAINALGGTLLSTTDVYDLTATQDATALDPAGDYRLELTYTVTAGTTL